ncbi:MAG: succinate dehydrogenase, hydrophobic membrane anchor protein [Pseudomonadota bacterium]
MDSPWHCTVGANLRRRSAVKKILSGLRAWTVQRVSALYLLGFTIYFSLHLLINPPASQQMWRMYILTPAPQVTTLLFFAALAIHAWVGVRDVILDYLKPFPLRITALAVLAVGLAATTIWAGALLLG